MSERVVAVTGATGRQGGAVARHLMGDGWRVRALTRNPDGAKAAALRALGAEIVQVDMSLPETLRPAFEGAYGVYSVQNPMVSGLEMEVVQGKNVADAAKQAAVEHLVYGSAGVGRPTGVGSWDSKLAVQSHMRTLGLPVTVLRPKAFMELMNDRGYFPPVSTWYVMPKLTGAQRPIYWLSVDDLGAIAARVFADRNRYLGVELDLVSDIRSNDECRSMWRELMGRAPLSIPMPVRLLERFVGTDITTMWRWLRENEIADSRADTYAVLPTALTVRQWLERQRSTPTRS
jgi:uncharacterized protein YbjT (DUF2867 family)